MNWKPGYKEKLLIALTPFGFVMMLAFYLSDYLASLSVNWVKTKQIIDVLQSIATISALIIGAVWAYYKFFKGRVYRPRLESKVSGEIIEDGTAKYLSVTAQLKNVGLSSCNINQEGTGIRILLCSEATGTIRVKPKSLGVLPIFIDHEWIESSESIEDKIIAALPAEEYFAVLIEFRLSSGTIKWMAKAVIDPRPKKTETANEKIDYEKIGAMIEEKLGKILPLIVPPAEIVSPPFISPPDSIDEG